MWELGDMSPWRFTKSFKWRTRSPLFKRCERSSPCCIMIRRKNHMLTVEWGHVTRATDLWQRIEKRMNHVFLCLRKHRAQLCVDPLFGYGLFLHLLMLAWSAWGIFRRRFEVGTGVLSERLIWHPTAACSCSRCSLSCLQPPVSFHISATSIWRQNARNPSTRALITLVCPLVSHALSSQLS